MEFKKNYSKTLTSISGSKYILIPNEWLDFIKTKNNIDKKKEITDVEIKIDDDRIIIKAIFNGEILK